MENDVNEPPGSLWNRVIGVVASNNENDFTDKEESMVDGWDCLWRKFAGVINNLYVYPK